MTKSMMQAIEEIKAENVKKDWLEIVVKQQDNKKVKLSIVIESALQLHHAAARNIKIVVPFGSTFIKDKAFEIYIDEQTTGAVHNMVASAIKNFLHSGPGTIVIKDDIKSLNHI